MTTSLGQVDADPDALVTGQALTLSLQGVLVNIVTPVDVTTQLLNLTLANVDPSPDVAVTGIQMNMSINSVSIDSTVVTGQGLTTSLNSVTPIVDVTVNVTGQQLTTSLNSPTFIGNGVVNLTGNLLTISLNSINNQICTEINTGTGGITLTFNEGWYLITLDSGIKQWIYLNSEKNTNIVPTSTVEYYSGISFSSDYIDCTEDTSLLDNSSGSPSQSICGADRYQINFTTAGITGVTGFNEGTFQKIVKFTLTGSTLSVSYINGLTI